MDTETQQTRAESGFWSGIRAAFTPESFEYRLEEFVFSRYTPDVFLPILLWSLLSLLTLGLALPFALVCYLRWRGNTYEITNERLLARLGVLHKDSINMELEDVVAIDVRRTLFAPVWGQGEVVIFTVKHEWVVVTGLRQPRRFLGELKEAIARREPAVQLIRLLMD